MRCPLGCAVLLLTGLAGRSPAANHVLIELLPRPGADRVSPNELNDDGLVVGQSEHQPVVWRDGLVTVLPFEGVSAGVGAVNEQGHLAGNIAQKAVMWRGEPNWVSTELGGFSAGGTSGGSAINVHDVVVGSASGAGYVNWAFIWDEHSGLIPLPGLDEASHFLASATGINDAGQVSGYYPCFAQVCSGFLWDDGVVTDLPFVEALGIDNQGQVFGYFRECYENWCGPSSPRTWTDGVESVLLLQVPTDSAFTRGSNDLGHVVGVAGIHTEGGGLDAARAVLWVDTVPTDLNDLLPESSDWHLRTAIEINNNGVIIGVGAPPSGPQSRGFMLVPRPACHADLNENGAVDFADLLSLFTAWGPCNPGPGCLEDLDDDGGVDFADVLAVIAAWGECPSPPARPSR
ncbi:MAG: hypothetical protein GY715_01190 [Planctomycetes bacterium]|nr:hypothetical protein [Planctomycetota bacterium]